MNPDKKKAIEELAHKFVLAVHEIDKDHYSTVVVTSNDEALVVSNDDPLRAVMGIVSIRKMPFTLIDKDEPSFIYAGETKH
jgi:hypothetical protein